MSKRNMTSDPLTAALGRFRDPTATGFADAWVGLEPTFQSRKSVRKWQRMAGEPGGEDAYFLDPYMLRKQRKVARAIRKRYEADQERGLPHCLFARVELEDDLDQWRVRRQNLRFYWHDEGWEPLIVRFSLDPWPGSTMSDSSLSWKRTSSGCRATLGCLLRWRTAGRSSRCRPRPS
jgi:hypothetical protein